MFSCSRGVLVDLSVPSKGEVKLPLTVNSYQFSTSEIFITWNGFHGMRTRSNEFEDKGISHYQYAIGSERGKFDIRNFTVIPGALTNSFIVTGLNFYVDKTYFIQLRGDTDNSFQ